MHWKRSTQQALRATRSILGAAPWREDCLAGLQVPAPEAFPVALFNFTIDFELFWGNGNLGGRGHTLQQRINAAERQAENFYPFLKMLEELGFPISWAVLGCLADPFVAIAPERKFRPAWEKRDWYDLPDSVRKREPLWRGEPYLRELKKTGAEILSHGYAHIDYTDTAATDDVAWTDMSLSQQLLTDFGLSVNGFVFPCNAHAHGNLLSRAALRIARGPDRHWHFRPDGVFTPVGFWISPGVCSFRELKKLVLDGISRRAFIHPWMHLIECDLRCRDIEEFYRPLFSLVLEEQAKGRIRNISFREIADRLAPKND